MINKNKFECDNTLNHVALYVDKYGTITVASTFEPSENGQNYFVEVKHKQSCYKNTHDYYSQTLYKFRQFYRSKCKTFQADVLDTKNSEVNQLMSQFYNMIQYLLSNFDSKNSIIYALKFDDKDLKEFFSQVERNKFKYYASFGLRFSDTDVYTMYYFNKMLAKYAEENNYEVKFLPFNKQAMRCLICGENHMSHIACFESLNTINSSTLEHFSLEEENKDTLCEKYKLYKLFKSYDTITINILRDALPDVDFDILHDCSIITSQSTFTINTKQLIEKAVQEAYDKFNALGLELDEANESEEYEENEEYEEDNLSDNELLKGMPAGTKVIEYKNRKCALRPDGNIATYINGNLCCWSNKWQKWIEC